MTVRPAVIVLTIIAVLVVIAGALIAFPALRSFLRTAVLQEKALTGTFTWTVPEDMAPGEYTVEFAAGSDDDDLTTRPITIVVLSRNEFSAAGGDVTTEQAVGGGIEGGDSSREEISQPDSEAGSAEQLGQSSGRSFTFASQLGHFVSGSYSGAIVDNGVSAVVLAHPRAVLEKKIQVPADDYWLDVRVKHDMPGPIDAAVYLNGKAWKVFRLDKADNRYRTHRIGKVRDFSGGTIRFRFLNDVYDPSNPTDAQADRNLYISWWRLTTSDELVEGSTGAQASSPVLTRPLGWQLLPSLNSYIRDTLGPQHVNPDIWAYYARRLTVSPTSPESIQDAIHLQTVMRYWRGVRPTLPRGD